MIYRGEAEPTKVLASIEVDTSEISIEDVRRVLTDLREAITNGRAAMKFRILLPDNSEEKENGR